MALAQKIIPGLHRLAGGPQLYGRVSGILCGLAIFTASLALRFWFDPYLPAGFPYLTFFPAVIITGFVFGVEAGTIVAVLSGLASWYFFIPPINSFELNNATIIALGFYIFIVSVDLGLIHLMMRAYQAESRAKVERERLAEERETLARELDHRLKNIFATMNAVISLCQKHAETPKDLADRLREKLGAMARSNLLLRGLTGDDTATLDALVRNALDPFGAPEAGRLTTAGPVVPVSGSSIVALSLIFHELATNAAKYGALSNADGRIDVRWSIGEAPAGLELAIEWHEKNGPPVAVSHHNGFGSTLIRRVVGGFGGVWTPDFRVDGVHVTIKVPFANISAAPVHHAATGKRSPAMR